MRKSLARFCLTTKAVAAIGLLSLLSGPTFAEGPPNPRLWGITSSGEDGNRLWEFCGSAVDGPAPEACWIFVEGAFDGLAMEAGVDKAGIGKAPFCLPHGTNGVQMADVVRRYLSIHPELRNRGGAWLVREALSDAFPCATPPGR